jgi:hypothetical protein
MCHIATARGHIDSASNIHSQAQIRALEDDIGHNSDTPATASSKGKEKANGDGRAAKKARNGGM